MNKFVIINGSPKPKDSASSMIIEKIEEFLDIKPIVYQGTRLILQENNSKEMSDILNSDVLLFVFPLYVDSLPAPIIKVLTMIENEINRNGKNPIVYAITNCGFLEAEHNRFALDMIENFSTQVDMSWGYGLGIGGGGFIATQSENMAKGGPANNIYKALNELSNAMKNKSSKKENVFVRPKMPLFIYKFMGNLGWYLMARKYGAIRSLKARPYDNKK